LIPHLVQKHMDQQRKADRRDTLFIIAGGIAIGGLLLALFAYY